MGHGVTWGHMVMDMGSCGGHVGSCGGRHLAEGEGEAVGDAVTMGASHGGTWTWTWTWTWA
eukprot:7387273-Prymnesium_polylepis.1